MKKILSTVCYGFVLLLCLTTGVRAADLKKADDFFEKGTFQSALEEYDQVIKDTKDEREAFKAFYRGCESLTHLYRYGEAVERIRNYKGNLVGQDRYRFLALKAEILRNFLMQYGGYQRTDVLDVPGKEVFRLTPKEIREDISAAYTELWAARQELRKQSLKAEEYFLDLNNVDLQMYPTFLDYVVQSWLGHIAQSGNKEKQTNPQAQSLLADDFTQPLDLNDPAGLVMAELIEAVIKEHGKDNLEARERLKIQRLLLPVKMQYFYAYPEGKNYLDHALEVKDVLLRWVDTLQHREARAEALFEAASLYQSWLAMAKEKLTQKRAHELCQRIEKEFAQTKVVARAQRLRQQIEIPLLYLQPKTDGKPGQREYLVTTKNIRGVFFRLYSFDPQRVVDINRDQNNNRGFTGIFNNYPYPSWIKEITQQELPLKAWTQSTKDNGAFEPLNNDVVLPELDKGLYLLLVSADKDFTFGSALLSATVVNVTDLVVLGTTGVTEATLAAYYRYIEDEAAPDKITDAISRLYVVNATSGLPVEDANISLINLSDNEKRFSLKTGRGGEAPFLYPVSVYPGVGNWLNFDIMATKNQSYAFFQNPLYFNYNPRSPYDIFIETDRPIYRPGDKVQVKVIVVKHISSGIKTVDPLGKVQVSARDTNGKDFFTQELVLNDFGSASIEFVIPSGRLLGSYSISAYYNARFSNSSSVNFSVEEYKRPEFELTFKDADKPWKYGEPVEIKGNAKYYFGGAVPDAPVSYRIRRQWYVPYCFRYWFGRNYSFDDGGQEITSGKVTTDKEGNFTIAFTPTSSGQNNYYGQLLDISAFSVEVDGRDAGGRTIQASHSFRAGKNALYFEITPEKGFFWEGAVAKIASRQLTMNDQPLEGTASYEVYALSSEAVQNPSGYQGNWQEMPALLLQLKDIKNGLLAVSGQVRYDKEGKGTIELKSLKSGAYRLVLKTKDSWGEDVVQDQIVVVAKDARTAVPLAAYSVTLAERQEYAVGETARFVIGSSKGAGKYFLEIWTGEYLHEKRLINSDRPVQVVEIPVTVALKGGFTLRWFGVKDHAVWYGQESVSVPWTEKKLTLELDPFTPELTPGQDVTWGIKVSDQEDKPVSSEVMALMYDRSLEYYLSSSYPWLDGLYTPRVGQDYNYGFDSVWPMNVFQIPVTEGLLKKILNSFEPLAEDYRVPGLRTWQTWAQDRRRNERSNFYPGDSGADGYLRRDKVVDEVFRSLSLSAPAEDTARGSGKKKERQMLEKAGKPQDQNAQGGSAGGSAVVVPTRAAFADTAFFQPHILTASDGKGSFTFKVPDQLTSWKVKAFAFTKDAKEGTVVQEAVTRKDLMVRVDIPRFFREKDKGTITAFVHNEGKAVLKGQLKIAVTKGKENIDQQIKLSDTTREFTVEPHSQQSFDWLIDVPPGVATYTVRTQAVAGELSDAEERVLPILPSRERLMESRLVALSGNATQKMEIKLADDPTRINETMNLQVDPQLFLTVMNAIPFLVEYPYECVEQILNKYVPLSIMHQVYQKHPEVQRAVGKIPKRATPTPAWEKEDPNRLMTLMETPWVWESEGRPTIWPVIDMLSPETVKAKEEENLQKLRNAQLGNGAFPWWPGGQEDPYITLYVLAGLSQARRYGVEVPSDMIERALSYVNQEIPLRLKPEAYDLSLISMAAYVVTSFPENEFSASRAGFEAARAWVKFLETNIHALTQFGKAYLAYTYLNLGDTKRANEVLDMALDGSREDPITGVYWAPEKYSWVWYSDTLEMHAFLLRTLQELRPEDKRIDGMVQWLLFNRKGNVWKSTKASVAAVFALLDYMNKKGSLVSDENFQVQWGQTTDAVTVAADDWLDKPLRWQKKGFEITSADTTATVSKDGPGLTFASLNWTYSTDQIPQASEPGILALERMFYRRVKEGEAYHLKPLASGATVNVGDQIEVQLKINTRSQFEYVHLKDPKAAGFEAETLLSGWKYDPLWFYEEPRDSLSNFFMSQVPHGEYILRYRLKPTKPGTYRIGAATLQPMYAPEMSAHSDGFIINVTGK